VSETKDHPVAGYVFAAVLGALAVFLVGMLNTIETALFAAPFLIGWALVSVALFGPSTHDH
jgi:hypothetical protein